MIYNIIDYGTKISSFVILLDRHCWVLFFWQVYLKGRKRKSLFSVPHPHSFVFYSFTSPSFIFDRWHNNQLGVLVIQCGNKLFTSNIFTSNKPQKLHQHPKLISRISNLTVSLHERMKVTLPISSSILPMILKHNEYGILTSLPVASEVLKLK